MWRLAVGKRGAVVGKGPRWSVARDEVSEAFSVLLLLLRLCRGSASTGRSFSASGVLKSTALTGRLKDVTAAGQPIERGSCRCRCSPSSPVAGATRSPSIGLIPVHGQPSTAPPPTRAADDHPKVNAAIPVQCHPYANRQVWISRTPTKLNRNSAMPEYDLLTVLVLEAHTCFCARIPFHLVHTFSRNPPSFVKVCLNEQDRRICSVIKPTIPGTV